MEVQNPLILFNNQTKSEWYILCLLPFRTDANFFEGFNKFLITNQREVRNETREIISFFYVSSKQRN
jgi:hypothetical protein